MLRQVCGNLFTIVALASIFPSWALAQEQTEFLEKNNNWSVQISNRSIPPRQALEKLTAFEQGRAN